VKFVNEMCGLNDEIIVCGDFNLQKVSWVYDEEEKCMLPINVTKEKSITVLDGMAINDLCQINTIPNKRNRFYFPHIKYGKVLVSPPTNQKFFFTNFNVLRHFIP
jgi:hypothetical protein